MGLSLGLGTMRLVAYEVLPTALALLQFFGLVSEKTRDIAEQTALEPD